MDDHRLVSLTEVRAAAAALTGVIVRTPVVACPWLDRPDGGLWLKLESLQVTGAFKIRGAYNALAAMPHSQRTAGVVTASSGNHGQALAYAAAQYNVPCVVVMPKGAAEVKVAATRQLGADVVFAPAPETHEHAHRTAATRGLTFVPPYSDRHVIAGQATIGLEILGDRPDVEVVLVPVGGGGLASGIGTAFSALKPSVHVIGIEPELAADAAASLAARAVQNWPADQRGRTIADGLRSGITDFTLAHLLEHLDGILTVPEEAIATTVGLLARAAHLVVEASGAVAAAGYLRRQADLPRGRTVAVVSGGNIDPALLASFITTP